MPASDVLRPDGTDYDSFLFAEVGEDRSGALVTVLSVFARLGLEPCTEAQELALLGRRQAQARLTAHFSATTDMQALVLASENTAAKLLSLLPVRAPYHVSKPLGAGIRILPPVSISWTLIAVGGFVFLALIFYLAQTG